MADTVRVTIPKPSASQDMNAQDWKKVLKGAGIAFGGAMAFSILMWMQAAFAASNFSWSVFWTSFRISAIPAALSVGINTLILYFRGERK